MKTANRILVAEDEPDTLRGIEKILCKEGYRVEAVKDGRVAINRLRSEPFDVVVTDLKLPGADGLEVLRTAKEVDRNVAVIIITGYATLDSALEAMRMGTFDYIPKPCSPNHLKTAVQKGILHKAEKQVPPDIKAAKGVVDAPKHLFKDQEAWVSVQPDGTASVGAVGGFFNLQGDTIWCVLPRRGDRIVRGQVCAKVLGFSPDRYSKVLSKRFRSPLTGTVTRVNTKLQNDPWQRKEPAYGDGWLFSVVPDKLEEEVPDL